MRYEWVHRSRWMALKADISYHVGLSNLRNVLNNSTASTMHIGFTVEEADKGDSMSWAVEAWALWLAAAPRRSRHRSDFTSHSHSAIGTHPFTLKTYTLPKKLNNHGRPI